MCAVRCIDRVRYCSRGGIVVTVVVVAVVAVVAVVLVLVLVDVAAFDGDVATIRSNR